MSLNVRDGTRVSRRLARVAEVIENLRTEAA
jgi:hypothetical protein